MYMYMWHYMYVCDWMLLSNQMQHGRSLQWNGTITMYVTMLFRQENATLVLECYPLSSFCPRPKTTLVQIVFSMLEEIYK